jgi:hypothetical protein
MRRGMRLWGRWRRRRSRGSRGGGFCGNPGLRSETWSTRIGGGVKGSQNGRLLRRRDVVSPLRLRAEGWTEEQRQRKKQIPARRLPERQAHEQDRALGGSWGLRAPTHDDETVMNGAPGETWGTRDYGGVEGSMKNGRLRVRSGFLVALGMADRKARAKAKEEADSQRE